MVTDNLYYSHSWNEEALLLDSMFIYIQNEKL
jgi:hypothetical protein